MRRVLAMLAIGLGLGLIALPLAYSMFDRTADAERILDRFEFLTLGSNPARYLDEAETTRAGSTELVEEAIPSLASEAGLSVSELEASFPALAVARHEVPEAHDFSVRYSEQLDAVDEEFQSVYDIPVGGLPLTSTPWLFVLSGLACLVAGSIALFTPGRPAIVAILVLGVAAVLGPLALGALGKSADGEDVKDFASAGLTERAATAAQDASAALDAMVKEADEQILPDLARRQGILGSELDRELNSRFPAAGKFLADWDEIGPRLSRLADAVTQSVDGFESAKKMPIALPVWLLFGSGLAMSALAGAALFRERP